jgi:hypothetical protein
LTPAGGEANLEQMMNMWMGFAMRHARFLTVVALSAVIVSPAASQSNNSFETRDDAQRRRQAEQYYYEKEQERRGNLLNTEKPRPLGEAPPSHFSTPKVPRAEDQQQSGPRSTPR